MFAAPSLAARPTTAARGGAMRVGTATTSAPAVRHAAPARRRVTTMAAKGPPIFLHTSECSTVCYTRRSKLRSDAALLRWNTRGKQSLLLFFFLLTSLSFFPLPPKRNSPPSLRLHQARAPGGQGQSCPSRRPGARCQGTAMQEIACAKGENVTVVDVFVATQIDQVPDSSCRSLPREPLAVLSLFRFSTACIPMSW